MKIVNSTIYKKALDWFANGNTGLSSEFLCLTLCGIKSRYAHPHDPSDFNRCLNMLNHIPELKERLILIKKESKEWSSLVENWENLEVCLKAEAELGDKAPITYKAMKQMGL